MTSQTARAHAAAIAAGKTYQAGVIRAMLFQRVHDTVSIPSLDVNVSVQTLTTAIADYLNKWAGFASTTSAKLVHPLVDASGVHLTNINNEGITYLLSARQSCLCVIRP